MQSDQQSSCSSSPSEETNTVAFSDLLLINTTTSFDSAFQNAYFRRLFKMIHHSQGSVRFGQCHVLFKATARLWSWAKENEVWLLVVNGSNFVSYQLGPPPWEVSRCHNRIIGRSYACLFNATVVIPSCQESLNVKHVRSFARTGNRSARLRLEPSWKGGLLLWRI